jgi:ribonuclease-3
MGGADDKQVAWVAQSLGYRFADPALLDRALNHRSARGKSNERLEFLGDAVLDTVVSEYLYTEFPDATEGVLSRLRASLVRDKSLAEIASSLDLGAQLRLGSGELKSGGSRRQSILADALEALFGAVFLDRGYDAAAEVVRSALAERLDTVALADAGKDSKTRLQEWVQSRGHALPVYTLLATEGAPHQQTFHVRCDVADLQLEAEGRGGSRRSAEQRAARAVLAALGPESRATQ